MKRLEPPRPLTADEIAGVADRGEDISRFFTNAGTMMLPVQIEESKPTEDYTKYDIVDE
jgi:hypothetical protein